MPRGAHEGVQKSLGERTSPRRAAPLMSGGDSWFIEAAALAQLPQFAPIPADFEPGSGRKCLRKEERDPEIRV
jgi:hypothetical protein